MAIRSVVLVRDLGQGPRSVTTGEVPGPWDSVEEAVSEALLDGQRYRVIGDVIYAQAECE
jgi:hypothetical protein